jgi:putative endonuclease
MSNKPKGTLYIGVTNNLARRVYEHKEGLIEGFTKRYNIKCLVHFEEIADVNSAIQREKNLKTWLRKWKIELIENLNPDWKDLYQEII